MERRERKPRRDAMPPVMARGYYNHQTAGNDVCRGNACVAPTIHGILDCFGQALAMMGGIMKRYFIILAFAGVTACLHGCKEKEALTVTGTLEGVVSDFKTGKTLDGVAVDMVSNAITTFITRSTATDENGKFTFANVEAGNYRISFARSGYSDNSVDVNVPAGQIATADVILDIHPDFVINDGVLTRYSGPGGHVILPEGITRIDANVFEGNQRLLSVVIPEGVTDIGDNAFHYCENLVSVHLPEGLLSIGDVAFCFTGLTTVTLPNSLIDLGQEAFFGCKISDIKLGANISSVSRPFGANYYLTSLSIDERNPYFTVEDNVLFDKAKTTLIQCVASKRGDYAIPEGVTTLAISAFTACRYLNSISIPSSVASLDYYGIFANCFELKIMTVARSQPITEASITANLFPGVSLNSVVLRVPAGSKANYTGAPVWREFGQIVEY